MTLLLIIHFLMSDYNSVSYKKSLISDTEWEDVISNRSQNELKFKLVFNNDELIKDNNGIYYYSMILGSSRSYTPRILKQDVQIKFRQEITDDMIKNNIPLEALVYNDEYYDVVSIVLTKLPILKIDYSDKLSNEYIDMSMYLYDNRENSMSRVTISKGEIHYRGATSLAYPKKGYHFKLNKVSTGDNIRGNDISLLGMRKDNDWILNALYSDQEKIRTVFSSKLWYDCCSKNNSFRIDNGNEFKYVEVILNGEYNGLYALGNPIDEKQMSLSKNKDGYYNEYLFKKSGTNGHDKSLTIKDLKENHEIKNALYSDEAWDILQNSYDKIFNGTDEEKMSTVDLNNYIDIYLFYNLIQGVDNVTLDNTINNSYITLKKYNNSYIMLITPWDLDQTFGNRWSLRSKNNISMYGIGFEENRIMKLNPVFLLEDKEDINNKLLDRYNELRNTYWSDDSISKILFQYESEIYGSGAFLRDEERWPSGNYNDAEEMLSKFKDYVYNRVGYLDSNLNFLVN